MTQSVASSKPRAAHDSRMNSHSLLDAGSLAISDPLTTSDSSTNSDPFASQYSSATADRVASSHGFMDLSAELRLQIYKLALLRKEPIMITPSNAAHQQEPPLLRTNRLIRNEAIEIWYKDNRFPLVIYRIPCITQLAWLRNRQSRDLAPTRLELAPACTQRGLSHFEDAFANCRHYPNLGITITGSGLINTNSLYTTDVVKSAWETLETFANAGVDVNSIGLVSYYGYRKLAERDAEVGLSEYWKAIMRTLMPKVQVDLTLQQVDSVTLRIVRFAQLGGD